MLWWLLQKEAANIKAQPEFQKHQIKLINRISQYIKICLQQMEHSENSYQGQTKFKTKQKKTKELVML